MPFLVTIGDSSEISRHSHARSEANHPVESGIYLVREHAAARSDVSASSTTIVTGTSNATPLPAWLRCPHFRFSHCTNRRALFRYHGCTAVPVLDTWAEVAYQSRNRSFRLRPAHVQPYFQPSQFEPCNTTPTGWQNLQMVRGPRLEPHKFVPLPAPRKSSSDAYINPNAAL